MRTEIINIYKMQLSTEKYKLTKLPGKKATIC